MHLHCNTASSILDAGLEVEVKDPPKGMIPPGTQMVKPKAEPQPNKVGTSSLHEVEASSFSCYWKKGF